MHVPPRLYLADNSGLVGLSVLGHDHGPADETLVGEKSKAQCFLGADWDAGLVDICDAGLGHALFEVVDNVRIVGSPSSHVDLVDAVFRTPSFVRIGKRLGGDAGDGCNAILGGRSLCRMKLAVCTTKK